MKILSGTKKLHNFESILSPNTMRAAKIENFTAVRLTTSHFHCMCKYPKTTAFKGLQVWLLAKRVHKMLMNSGFM